MKRTYWTFLATTFILLISYSAIPSIAAPQVFQGISSYGMVVYPEHELGLFFVGSGATIPNEASWVVAAKPNYEKPRENISVILNWYTLHPPNTNDWKITTVDELKIIEDGLKSVQTEKFWGIIFICEEHYRIHVAFNDDVNTTWFGERLLGYPLYLRESPNATKEEWKDEMFLRMIRGFYNYFHAKTKVGITANAGSTVPNYRNRSWDTGISKFFGWPAWNFITQKYDFVYCYSYTRNLDDFEWTKKYYSIIDQHLQRLKKFWIITRIWSNNEDVWEPEAIALEAKNCLDRNIVVTSYYNTNPPLQESWALIKKSIQLYDEKAPYYEQYVYGENLLTGFVGKTCGWVKV